MKSDHPDLREIYQAYVSARRPTGRKKCPSPDVIAKSFESSFSARKKKMIVDHISECQMCREEFMMFLEHQKASEEIIPCSEYPRKRIREESRQYVLWQGALAMLGLSLIVSSFFIIRNQHVDSALRHPGADEITIIIPERNPSLSVPLIFRWLGKPGTEYYILEIFDKSLLPVWASGKRKETQLRLPADVLSTFRPGQVFYWMVTSYTFGLKTGESALSRFEISR